MEVRRGLLWIEEMLMATVWTSFLAGLNLWAVMCVQKPVQGYTHFRTSRGVNGWTIRLAKSQWWQPRLFGRCCACVMVLPRSQKTRGPFSSSLSFHLRPFWYDGKEDGGSGFFGETFRVSNGTGRWLYRRTTVLGSTFLCFIFNLVSVLPAHRMLESCTDHPQSDDDSVQKRPWHCNWKTGADFICAH